MINRLPYPHARVLEAYARAAGVRMATDPETLKRVFRVDDLMYGSAPDFQTGTELDRQPDASNAES